MDTPDNNPFTMFIGKDIKIQTERELISGKGSSFSGHNTIIGKLIRAYAQFIIIETKDKFISIKNDGIICVEMDKAKK